MSLCAFFGAKFCVARFGGPFDANVLTICVWNHVVGLCVLEPKILDFLCLLELNFAVLERQFLLLCLLESSLGFLWLLEPNFGLSIRGVLASIYLNLAVVLLLQCIKTFLRPSWLNLANESAELLWNHLSIILASLAHLGEAF